MLEDSSFTNAQALIVYADIVSLTAQDALDQSNVLFVDVDTTSLALMSVEDVTQHATAVIDLANVIPVVDVSSLTL